MPYSFHGSFVEACDCALICPCWLDDAPDDEHCTGLFAWQVDDGAIDGVPVGGRTVVSVSTHSGQRRQAPSATAIFVDDGATQPEFIALTRAFAGELAGPLAGLAAVSGTVLLRTRAQVTVVTHPDGSWKIVVRPTAAADPDAAWVRAEGEPRFFEGEAGPLRLRSTALSRELSVPPPGDVVAQQAGAYSVHVPVLPGAYLDVTGRSAMRGAFRYQDPAPAAGGR